LWWIAEIEGHESSRLITRHVVKVNVKRENVKREASNFAEAFKQE
jgi:hypothetical protein